MDTNKDNRNDDRDTELQNRDRDKAQQSQDGKPNEEGSNKKTEKISGNPERLHDNEHQMNKRTNDVQGEVDYGQNRHQPNEEPSRELESRWTDIESDYRHRYPKLTDDDVNYNSGEFERMADRIAKRTNRTPEDVTREIRDWDRNHLKR
ncbi:hypothetical protein [Gelidibacter sp.]|uniref:hypothetical protein n=1 Tax=Gelidibacter sp. TaxID=2018083 RepID=UPI002B9345AA|nr:hypothetical protein [Gelidibacter sp.]HUH26626.1 hypothetical protein [Gelidibacter sp.]